MTPDNRAVKVNNLAKVCDWVDGQWIDEFGYGTLTWPAPKSQQKAEIDVRSGVILKFVLQSGTSVEEVSIDGYQSMIDRRINYLCWRYSDRINDRV